MADENKPLKYMRYAIGEIILVVIGILIALQINNWNEERKTKDTVQNYLSMVLKLQASYTLKNFTEEESLGRFKFMLSRIDTLSSVLQYQLQK